MKIPILATLISLMLSDLALAGTATYYGRSFNGRKMANGRRFNPNHMVAAHPSYPFGTQLRVTNRRTKRSVVVTVTDRCSCTIDLSPAAFRQIGNLRKGRIPVSITRL
ncbi:MAG: septal ring lytic transglycosylase RlpA family protein [Snowella sp.]|nr:septal ring lytic transglycosylase RlpA family protein [Snowella sp.]